MREYKESIETIMMNFFGKSFCLIKISNKRLNNDEGLAQSEGKRLVEGDTSGFYIPLFIIPGSWPIIHDT
jgi:hypothetical protein